MKNEARATPGNVASGEDEADRVAEHGETDEPDAPTAEEENEGMSTILSAEPALGVQPDASEE